MADALPLTKADLDTATRTLYGECRGEPLEGQQGVAWVIRRRAERSGHSVEQVCTTRKQFSCWNADDVNRNKLLALPADSAEYKALAEVVRSVMAGEVDDPTNGATNYCVRGEHPYWTQDASPCAQIGKHDFYAL